MLRIPPVAAAFILGACLLTSTIRPHPAWATEYFSEIADLPVADGLTEQKDKSTVFDAPVGRIITAYASGKVDADAVRDFYDSALPPLGWEKTGEGTFHRKAETLKIDVLGGQGGSPVNVSFTLSAESQQQ
ncbi:MAG TPA: hypothetical protein VFZ03_15000 [Dongiaceae bacterium]